MAEDKNKLKDIFEAIRDEKVKHANTAKRIGNAFLSLLNYAAADDEKLSSVYNDTAHGIITFAKGLVSSALAKLASLFVSGDTQLGENGTKTTFGNFQSEASGASISVSEDGTSTAEFDFLNIRRAAYFREVTVNELKHIGGELALTAAAMTCSKVEWLNARGRVITAGTPTYYKCYFETTDGKRTIYQDFAVGDQARCQQFRIASGSSSFESTKYYWRLVTGVGENYIILSNQDGKFDGVGLPEVGDNIVQLGYQGGDNPIRTSAIILSATAADAPSTKYYSGITSFSLQDCEVKDEGFEGGQFQSRIYGTYYVGDREQTNYMSYDPVTKKATFKGQAIFEAGTTLPDGTPIEQLQGLGIKSGNLLGNSGFTGDYSSREMQADMDITDETAIFSDSAKGWESENAEFIETSESESHHAVTLSDGSLAQQLSSLASGEKYTLAFKARGSSLRFTVGGYSETIELTDELKRYSVIFTCTDATDLRFRIFEADATVMEITLNQGNLPINWAAAYDDNDKSLADFEAFRYLLSAITEAKTTVNGGLVMTQDIRVGQYRDGTMTKETGGMSGYAATKNSPFIWGGGSLAQAFRTIGKYVNDPGYQATDEELRDMCAFVVTHGGRAILNDIILHGYIYAKGGVLQSVRSPNGNFAIDENGNVKAKGEINANSGSIGGFEIGSNRIGSKQTFDDKGSLPYSSANQMSLYLSEIIFNSKDRQAIIGCCTHYIDFLLRLTDTRKDTMPRYGGIIGVQGSVDENIAMEYIGGYMSGVNFKNKICGFTHYAYSSKQTTMPTYKDFEIDRTVNCVYATTKCYWKGQNDEKESETNQWVNIKLPELKWYDDGHEILIKRGLCNDNKVNIQARRFCNLEVTYSDSFVPTYKEVWYDTILLNDRGDWTTERQLGSEMDSTCYRFFKDLSVTITAKDGTTKDYRGVWVEFKHPRDW